MRWALLFLFFLPAWLLGQSSLFVEGVVKDFQTQQPVSYANVYNLSNKKGTVTDTKGYFKLEVNSPADTVRFSSIGYTTWYMQGNVEHLSSFEIWLKPRSSSLPEIKVVAESSYLYTLVAGIKNKKKTRQAKTYFQLETFLNNEQAELVQAYYNGEFSGYYPEALHLKNGRLALKRINSGVFVSTEISRAISMYRFFEKDDYFPVNPLQLSRSKMIKAYSLQLVNRYREESGQLIHVVQFLPKTDDSLYFQGRLWIDSAGSTLHKMELEINDTWRHPFTPITDKEQIKNIRLELNMSFENIDGSMYVNRIDFNYSFTYKNRRNNFVDVSTHAFLSAYDYQGLFDLPFFEFPVANNSDYRNIAAVPYNEFFWKHNRDFSVADVDGRAMKFFNRPDVINSLGFLHNNEDALNKGFFQHPYIHWDQHRISFSEIRDDSLINMAKNPAYVSDMYNLKIQLYLDINVFNDTLSVLTEAIFDPFGSYYFLPIYAKNTCFLNIYFDMVEIERRKLETTIVAKNMKVEEVKALYLQAIAAHEENSRLFFKEVERGENYEGLLKWNLYVKNHLGIDNMALFGVYNK